MWTSCTRLRRQQIVILRLLLLPYCWSLGHWSGRRFPSTRYTSNGSIWRSLSYFGTSFSHSRSASNRTSFGRWSHFIAVVVHEHSSLHHHHHLLLHIATSWHRVANHASLIAPTRFDNFSKIVPCLLIVPLLFSLNLTQFRHHVLVNWICRSNFQLVWNFEFIEHG